MHNSQIIQAFNAHNQGDTALAIKIYQSILTSNPNNYDALYLLGIIEQEAGNFDKAFKLLNRALLINTKDAKIYNALGNTMLLQNAYTTAIQYFEQALNLDPNYYYALYGLGNSYLGLSDLKKAESYFYQCLTQHDFTPAKKQLIMLLNNQALALKKEAQFIPAIELLKQALKFEPDNFETLNNLSIIYTAIGEHQKAIEILSKNIHKATKAQLINLYTNLATSYMLQENHNEAIKYYNLALKLKSNIPEAYLNLGAIYLKQQSYLQAYNNIKLAIQYMPEDFDYSAQAYSLLLQTVRFLCLWDEIDNTVHKMLSAVEYLWQNNKQSHIVPFNILTLDNNIEFQLKILDEKANILNKINNNIRISANKNIKNQKINLAYISPDFCNHPVGLLINDLFKYHDRSRFNITALATKKHNDNIATTIKNSVPQFIDLSKTSTAAAIQTMKNLNLDLLIDLTGLTEGLRPELLFARTARIQAHWLGYSTTTRLACIDYYITTQAHVPENLVNLFTERLAFLPNSMIATDFSKFLTIPTSTTRYNYNLPQDAVVYCCFNNHYRIDPIIFKTWMEILQAVPNSVLWLKSLNSTTHDNLKLELTKYNIEPKRLIFGPSTPLSVTWHHTLADLWLDTKVMSAGTASMIAAYAGLPLLALPGNTPQTRIAAATNAAYPMPELNATSLDDYREKAIFYGNNPAALQDLKTRMLTNKSKSPLFNVADFCQDLERLYQSLLKWP